MKSLVVYYSKTGNTKKVALEIAKMLNAEVDEIKDRKKIGFLRMLSYCGKAMKQKTSDIDFSKNPADYEMVVLGGPVWAWNLLPQLRSYLELNNEKIKKFAFFVTYGGNLGKNFEQVSKIKQPAAAAGFIDKKVKKDEYKNELEEFVKKL